MIPTCDEIREAVRKYNRENPTECCLEHERSRDECLLRTLDKALYEIGTPQKD